MKELCKARLEISRKQKVFVDEILIKRERIVLYVHRQESPIRICGPTSRAIFAIAVGRKHRRECKYDRRNAARWPTSWCW